jgi:hypothetical protein
MTAQIPERLTYQGNEHAMCTNPLSDYFSMVGESPNFEMSCTALWRGYVGSWEIIADRLYLTGLSGRLEGGGRASLEMVFPGFHDRVFAHWYSGSIRLPQGRQLEYVHMGYGSTYEQDLLLTIERGVVTQQTTKQNGKADVDAPDGYGVAAMTIFSDKSKEP